MTFLNRIRKVIGNLVDNTDPLNPIVSLDNLTTSSQTTKCGDSVLTKSVVPVLLNDTYFGWSEPEGVQWSNIAAWDNRTWKVFFSNLDTDGLGGTTTTVSISAFTSFQELINELNNQLVNYGSSFRLIGHQDGNRILVTDLSFNPLLVGDPYFITYNFQSMELVIEDASTGNDWLVKGRKPKDLLLSNVEFSGDTGYVFKKLQCICDELKDLPIEAYNPLDTFVAIGSSSTTDRQGWFYDGLGDGTGKMEVPFIPNNSVSINALQVNGVDYIPGGSITNTYLTFQDFIDFVNGLLVSSGVQLATSSNNDFYVVGSNGSPIPQTLTFDFYDNTASGWFTKAWLPDTIQIVLDGVCKRVQLPIESQDWKLQGNSGINALTDFIGTTDLNPLFFKSNNVKRGCFTRNGNFVVGVNESLIEQMDSSAFGFTGISTINTTHNIFNFSPTGSAFGWAGIAVGGSPSAPTLPVSNSLMGATNGLNYDGVGSFRTVCRMRYHNVGQPTATSMPTKIVFSTTKLNQVASSEALQISENQYIGIGLYAQFAQNPASHLDLGGSLGLAIRVVTTNTFIGQTDVTVVFNGTNLTGTLPTGAPRRFYNIKNINATNLSVTGNIDGTVQTITLSQFQSRTFHSDGTTWYLI